MNKYGADRSPETIAFLEAIVEVCKIHNKELGHEDSHGNFEVYDLDSTETFEWLLDATESSIDSHSTESNTQ